MVDQIEQTYESGGLAVESDPVFQDPNNSDIYYVYGQDENDEPSYSGSRWTKVLKSI